MAARSFAECRKDMTARSVHSPAPLKTVSTAYTQDDDERGKKVAKLFADVRKRSLQPHDGETAKTPFLYDVNALSSLRPDQVPRFFGALTDSDQLPTEEVDLSTLRAMQDRVDPVKIDAMRENGTGGKLPVIVRHNGNHYIADGHHRLAAQWLDGEDRATVRLKDLEPVSNALKRSPDVHARIAKVDESLGLVFGWAIVCKVDGEDYYDLNVDHAGKYAGERVPEHIPEDTMTKAAAEFMEKAQRPGNEMHDGPDKGSYVFMFPMTTDIAKAMGIETKKTGLMVAYKAPPDVLAKFKAGEYTGFSIEGSRLKCEEHP